MVGDRMYRGGGNFGIYYKNAYEYTDRGTKRVGKRILRSQYKKRIREEITVIENLIQENK